MSGPQLVGIDLVEPARMADRLSRTPALAADLFTDEERAYCDSCTHTEQHLAGRFAAKEATAKCLGLDGFEHLEIEVVAAGAVTHLELHGDAAARAEELGVNVFISITHLPSMAAAVAFARPASTMP